MRTSYLVACVITALALAAPAVADHGGADDASSMSHLANSPRAGSSDLAFWSGGPLHGPFQDLAFAGNFDGFRIFDISRPWLPRLLSDFRCRGNQGDGSVHQAHDRLIYIQSVDAATTGDQCATAVDFPGGTGPRFEGLRIFDVTNPLAPLHIASVPTVCGSHTHTTIPDDDDQRLIVYVASNPGGRGTVFCPQPHRKISIVEIPYADPESARLLKEQPLHYDTVETVLNGHSFGQACHDITAFLGSRPPIAFAACIGEGQLWDISDPANPSTLGAHTHIRNLALRAWHSASFTWDGKVLAVSDESSGRCLGAADTVGNMWFYKVVRPGTDAPLLGRYTPTRPHLQGECFPHNGNVIPTNHGYIGVAPFWRGGTSVYDFTDPAAAREIAYFDPTGVDDDRGSPQQWAAYWYNDYIFVSDYERGFDVFKLLDEKGKHYKARKWHHSNPQTQEGFQAVGNKR